MVTKSEIVGKEREQVRSRLHIVVGLVFLLMLVIWFVQTKEGQNSWNEASRLATIESLVERGTWQIDQSAFTEITGDKLLLNNHYYSEKPPLLQALSAIPYSLMHNLLGVELWVDVCKTDEICGYKWLTFIMVGVPSAIMIVLLYWGVSRELDSNWWALLIVSLFSFGTMIWPYSLVFNNHIPAAACLFASFMILLTARQSHIRKQRRLFWAGFLAALAVSLDLVTILIVFALLAIVIIYYRQAALTFALGSIIPILVTMLFDYQISGSLLPPYFSTEGYNYPGSPWSTTVAAMKVPDNIWDYAFRALIGDHGFLSHSPLLLWPIAGLLIVVRNRQHPFWLEGIFLTLGMIMYTFVILTRTDNFGGKAYGARFFIPLIPLLFYFAVFALPDSLKSLKGKLTVALLAVAIVLSVVSAYQGVARTWHRVKPLLFFQTRAYTPYLTVCSNQAIGLCLDAILDPCAPINVGNVERRFEVPTEIQYPLRANFSDKIMLLGYDLVTRRLKTGEALSIIVFWQGLQEMNQDYIQFNHVLDSQLTQRGGYDRSPRETYLTSCWQSGEVVVDGYTLPIDADAPAGVYNLHIGLYEENDGQATPLQLLENGQPNGVTSVTVGSFQIGGPPPGVVVPDAQPENLLDIDLGDVIRLRGYDLSRSEDALLIRLYWESMARTDMDYTVFVHVLDQAGEMIAQIDRPPVEGIYPTSLWDPGEVIPDDLVVPLPEELSTGQYSVIVGLYNSATGTRLKVHGSDDDTIRLGTLETESP